MKTIRSILALIAALAWKGYRLDPGYTVADWAKNGDYVILQIALVKEKTS